MLFFVRSVLYHMLEAQAHPYRPLILLSLPQNWVPRSIPVTSLKLPLQFYSFSYQSPEIKCKCNMNVQTIAHHLQTLLYVQDCINHVLKPEFSYFDRRESIGIFRRSLEIHLKKERDVACPHQPYLEG